MATKNTSVGRRLDHIALASFLCFLICVAVSVAGIFMISSDFKDFVGNEYSAVNARNGITRGNQGMGMNLCKMILSSTEGDMAEVEKSYQECLSDFKDMEDGISKLTESDSVHQNTVRSSMVRLQDSKKIIDEIHSLCRDGRTEEAWTLYKSDYAPVLDETSQALMKMLDDVENSANNHISHLTVFSSTMYIVVSVVGLVLLVFLIVVTKRTTRSIIEPLKELEISSEHLRSGKLDSHISFESDDELGALCTNFNTATEYLSSYVNEIADFSAAMSKGKLDYQQKVEFFGDFKQIGESLTSLSTTLSEDLRKISTSADQVSRGAAQMSAMGQSLSQSAVEQASSVQEVAATVNSVSDHVTENAANASEVRDTAKTLYENMSGYAVIMKDMNGTLTDTRAMTDKVSGIMKNLERISFQTNILSLNAAVEAARAGDAGKGFAVIAREIRELASEASQASTNTSLLLGNMIEKIEKSADYSSRAIDSLQTIKEESKQTADLIDKITRASNDQATSITQVRQSMNEISNSIQSISTTAEESAASAEELIGQMKLLNKMVDSFEFRKND